ncbi:MAG: type II secretion system protein [Acidobacteria bacterium]|nr:MAG: type II secretion system protein [Acidobacteriota bacterium]
MGRHRGFTLLEVVVALAIMGIGVATALSIFSGSLKNLRRIDMAHQAMSHAENVMNEILTDESIREPRDFSGNLDDEFSYTASVDMWEEPQERVSLNIVEPPAYMLSVRVDIHFKNDPNGKFYRSVCLKTISKEPLQQNQQMAPNEAIRRLFGGSNP